MNQRTGHTEANETGQKLSHQQAHDIIQEILCRISVSMDPAQCGVRMVKGKVTSVFGYNP